MTIFSAGIAGFYGSTRLTVQGDKTTNDKGADGEVTDKRRIKVGESIVVEAEVRDPSGAIVSFATSGGPDVVSSDAGLTVTLLQRTSTRILYTVKAVALPKATGVGNVQNVATLKSSIIGAAYVLPFIIVP